jgi:hypothetical protein
MTTLLNRSWNHTDGHLSGTNARTAGFWVKKRPYENELHLDCLVAPAKVSGSVV